MKRVTGIGGVFFKSNDPKALGAWYDLISKKSQAPEVTQRRPVARPASPAMSPAAYGASLHAC